MWVNKTTSVDNIFYLTVTLSGGTYTVEATVGAYSGQGSFGLSLGTFTSYADVQTALDGFLATVGEPWAAVGDASGIGANGDPAVIAVNMGTVTQIADGSTGIKVDAGWISVGYEPGTDFASARDALMAITGNVTFG